MGNACGCADGNVGDAPVTNIIPTKNQPEPFKQAGYKSKIAPEAFSALSTSDKEQLLVEILRLIVTKGDAAQIKTNNVHLKQQLIKQNQKIVTNGDIFDGEVIDGMANGRGKVKLVTGGDFDGQFIGGIRRAKGVTKHPNLTEEAYYNEDGQPEGIAHHKSANGLFQVLYYERGLRNGLSLSESATERTMELYVASKRNGLAVRVPKDYKTLSIQEFKEDKPNGAVVEYVPKAAPGPAQPAPQAPADPKAAPGPAQPAPQAPADPNAKPAQPAPQAAPQPGQPAPQPGQPAPQPGQPGQPAPANPAPGKPADPRAAPPQEKGPAPAPGQPAPGQPAPANPTPGAQKP